jgi:uncharacterized protein (DUF1499 family)
MDMPRLSAFLTDITTTPEAPPEFRALEREPRNVNRDMKYPAELAAMQRQRYPELAPLRSDLAIEQVFEQVQAAALDMRGWAIASVEAHRFSLEAVATTALFRFKDDVVIQVRAEVGGGATVHMRSKSRLPLTDFGASARQIRLFFARLAEKLR